MNNEIEKYTTETFNKLHDSIRNELDKPTRYLFQELAKNNITFYGNTALEVYLNMKPTIPLKAISKNTPKFFLPIFKDILNKFKVYFKIDKIPNANFYKLNLQNILIVYHVDEEEFEPYLQKVNDINIVNPLYSLMDTYFMYSTPLMNSNYWLDLINIDPKFIKTLTPKNNIKYNHSNNLERIYNKNYQVLKKINFFEQNILLTGIYAYNEMMNTEYQDPIDLMVYNSEDIIDKLQLVFSNKLSVITHPNNFIKYFDNYYVLKYGDIHLFTVYPMKDAYIYYHRTKRTNFHTTIFILLFKSISENTEKYIPLINNMLINASQEDLLNNNKFKCFEVGYLENAITSIMERRTKK